MCSWLRLTRGPYREALHAVLSVDASAQRTTYACSCEDVIVRLRDAKHPDIHRHPRMESRRTGTLGFGGHEVPAGVVLPGARVVARAGANIQSSTNNRTGGRAFGRRAILVRPRRSSGSPLRYPLLVRESGIRELQSMLISGLCCSAGTRHHSERGAGEPRGGPLNSCSGRRLARRARRVAALAGEVDARMPRRALCVSLIAKLRKGNESRYAPG